MNTYEKLREHYYSLFPEEKKLEFGCQYIINGEIGIFTVCAWDELNQSWITTHPATWDYGIKQDKLEGEDFVILGKPLSLQMILRILPENHYVDRYGVCSIFVGCGECCEDSIEYDFYINPSKEPKDWDEQILQAIWKLKDK